jgi:hypothetical protein
VSVDDDEIDEFDDAPLHPLSLAVPHRTSSPLLSTPLGTAVARLAMRSHGVDHSTNGLQAATADEITEGQNTYRRVDS